MLSRVFGGKPPREEPGGDPPQDPEPGLWDRIRTFFVLLWNWTILLGAIAGFLLCLRLTYGFWQTAMETPDTDTTLLFGAMAVGAAAGAAFLGWQSWRGFRFFQHRRRLGQ